MKTQYPTTDYLIKLAKEAGQMISDDFRLGMERELKEDTTPITKTDVSINRLVLDRLERDYPHVSVVSEEGSREVAGAEYTVLCDPIDGTIPFSRGTPLSTFVISVLKDQVPVSAVIYDPFMKRMWHANKGGGAFLGRTKVQVSKHAALKNSHICMIWWHSSKYNLNTVCGRLLEEGSKTGNPMTLAYFGGLLANGEYDATIFPGQKGWETAAMQLLAEEAGGRVTDIHGNPMSYGPKGEIEGHIISNDLIHDELVELVASCQS